MSELSSLTSKTGNCSMLVAALATIDASVCCVGPHVLIELGIGGLFMGVFWFLIIMPGLSLFKSLTGEQG